MIRVLRSHGEDETSTDMSPEAGETCAPPPLRENGIVQVDVRKKRLENLIKHCSNSIPRQHVHGRANS